MKKIVFTLMAFFYLAVASGAGVQLHYCMGELVDWSLVHSQQAACDFCGMEKKEASEKSCCKDVQQQAKVDQAQKANTQIYKFEQHVFVLPPLKPVMVDVIPMVSTIAYEVSANAPPLGQQLPLFIKNCTYRI
ncbi:hypothetical protein [Pedobacter sp.]|uniref:HYC_CC_PP family protein n=1 Tax=Pedobacter sp. TaxID=1411316 RepID=UPI0031DBDFE0